MIAVIIAGGMGTRLRPLTYATPKPLLPLCGKPIIDFQLDLCRRHGLTDVVLNLHYLSTELENYLGDGSRYGLHVRFSHEPQPLGTAGAVKMASAFFDSDPIVVFNGDVLTDCDLGALLEFHRQRDADATLAVTAVTDPTPFGLVMHLPDGSISGFLEKPSLEEARQLTESFWINAGVYVLEPQLFNAVPEGVPFSFERQLFPSAIADGLRLFAFESHGYWLDCGSPRSYIQAHRDLLAGRLPRPQSWTAWPRSGITLAWVEGNVDIPADLEIMSGPVYLGDGADIGSGVRLGQFAVIGPGAVVDSHARVEGAIVGQGAYVGPRSEVTGGIIGRFSRIEADVQLGEHTVLADYSVIGRGTFLNTFSPRSEPECPGRLA